MATFGDYVIPTWVNGASPAINADKLQAISNTIGALDQEARRSQTESFRMYLDYFLHRSTKVIETFQDSSEFSYTDCVISSDSANSRVGKFSLKIEENNNSAGWCSAYKSISSLDLTKFFSGETSATNDLICFMFTCTDATKYDYVTIKLGDDNTNNYSFNASVSTGKNFVTPAKSAFTTNNSPTGWDDITYVRIEGKTKDNADGEYITCDILLLQRVDPDTTYIPIPTILDDGNGNWDILKYDIYDKFALYFDPYIGKIGIQKGYDTWPYGLLIGASLKNFICVTEYYITVESEVPITRWHIDSDNYIEVCVNGGVAFLYLYEAATPTTVSEALVGLLEKYVKVLVTFEKNEDKVRVQFQFSNDEANVYLEAETTITDSGNLVTGGSYDDENMGFLTEVFVTNRETDKSFLKENKDNIVIVKTEDETRSSTSLDYDNELFVDLPANGIYEVIANLAVDSSSDVPDIDVMWYTSGDIELQDLRFCRGQSIYVTSASDSDHIKMRVYDSFTEQVPYGCDGTNYTYVEEKFIVNSGATGGRLHLRYAQHTTNVSAIIVKSGSYLRVTKVSR
jgi:hypothetical protein